MTVQVIILAAGQGKRMQSQLPKVLHLLAGKSLLQQVLNTAKKITQTPPCVIYGHQGQLLRDAFSHDTDIIWVEQKQQLGTGHALLQALPALSAVDGILVLYGDVPLISDQTLQKLLSSTPKNALGMITAIMQDPYGYGRIKRKPNGDVVAIVEEKDANDAERLINEVNTGIYYMPLAHLQHWLPQLNNQNLQNEYYLTDIIKLAVADNMTIHTIQPNDIEEVSGINDRMQLAKLERYQQSKQAEKLMRAGATLLDPTRVDIRGEVEVGQDVLIDVNVIFEGNVKIGNGCRIGANTIIRNSQLGNEVDIKSHCVIEEAEIASHAVIGPFARLRPGTKLASQTHVGNFVEIKNSQIGVGSKINHLSYIGDSDIGKQVNIGAGTITCNYDGANKHKTVIGDNVHIGSDTQLIAPITVGEGATIAAGSTLTKDAPANQLTLTAKLEQRSVKNWLRPVKG